MQVDNDRGAAVVPEESGDEENRKCRLCGQGRETIGKRVTL